MLLPHHHHMEVLARENRFMMVKTYSLLIRLWALWGLSLLLRGVIISSSLSYKPSIIGATAGGGAGGGSPPQL